MPAYFCQFMAILFAAVTFAISANATVAHTVPDSTAINLLMVAVSSMAAAIVFLFFWFRAEFAKCHTERADCHKQYTDLLLRVADLEK